MTDHSQHKKDTAATFGGAADAYLASAAHGGGADLEWLADWCDGASVALDVATGAGHTAGALVDTSIPDVIAADASPLMVQTAESAFEGVRGVVADAERLPFSDDSFDAVTCRIAAHHFPDPQAFVSEVARVIRPEGTFAFEDNVVDPEDAELGSFYNRLDELRDPTHVEAHRTSVWHEWIDEARFSIEETRHIKTHIEFEPWLNRHPLEPTRRDQVRELLLEAPAEAVEFFDIRRRDEAGTIQSFANWKAVVHARRTA